MRRGITQTPPRPTRPTRETHSFVLSGSDDALLRRISTFYFLTAEQATRLLYRPGSLKYVRDKLKRLAAAGYLHRLRLPSATAGNTAFVYTLGSKGMTYLSTAGVSEVARFRPAEQDERSYLFLSHTLAVNDVLIAATRLHDAVPAARLVDFLHERMLRSMPVAVQTGVGERMSIVPDAWMDFHLNNTARMSIVLELDRGTIEQVAFKRKLRGLVAFAQGPYQEAFHSPSLTIAVATTAGAHRCQLMRSWCEQVLTALHQEGEAEVFLFTALPAGALAPATLFLEAVWQQPFTTRPVTLLEL